MASSQPREPNTSQARVFTVGYVITPPLGFTIAVPAMVLLHNIIRLKAASTNT